MTIVYRIENPDGTGPYRGSNSKLNGLTMDFVESSSRHPSPRIDLKINDIVEKIQDNNDSLFSEQCWDILFQGKQFGFISKEQLKEWFSNHLLKGMFDVGAVVAEYEVNDKDIIVGEKQIMFRYKNKKKKQYNIAEYFNLLEMKIENISETEGAEQADEPTPDRGFALAA